MHCKNRTENINHIKKFKKIDIEKFTYIWKLTVCPCSWVPGSCLESESCGQQPECWPPKHGRLHQPPAELLLEESKNPEVRVMSDTVVLLIYMDINICCYSKIHSFKDVCHWQEWSIKSWVNLFILIYIFDFMDRLNNPQIQQTLK